MRQRKYKTVLRKTFRMDGYKRFRMSRMPVPEWLQEFHKNPDAVYNPYTLILEPMPYLAGLSRRKPPYRKGLEDLGKCSLGGNFTLLFTSCLSFLLLARAN